MALKRLFLDMYKCDRCESCKVECSAFYRPQLKDHGILTLRERAAFLLICRRCENPSCAAACRFQALERQPEGIMQRYSLRCVSCKCCSHACPFGTIYPETVPYYVTLCDFCFAWQPGAEPACQFRCPQQAIEYKEIEPSETEGIYLLNDHLAVRAPRWVKEKV